MHQGEYVFKQVAGQQKQQNNEYRQLGAMKFRFKNGYKKTYSPLAKT